jgi:hypothetical protein
MKFWYISVRIVNINWKFYSWGQINIFWKHSYLQERLWILSYHLEDKETPWPAGTVWYDGNRYSNLINKSVFTILHRIYQEIPQKLYIYHPVK